MTGQADPRWDPEAKARVRRAVDRMLIRIEDVIRRNTDRNGAWETPGDIAQFGDTTGILGVARHSVAQPLARVTQQALDELDEIESEIERYKRDLLGPGYRPPPKDKS